MQFSDHTIQFCQLYGMAQALHFTQFCLESEHTLSLQKQYLQVGRQEVPFVCLVLSPEVALILFASRDTHLLLQFVHCTRNTLFSLLPVLLGHGVLQILFQLQAQLSGRDKWDKITRQTHSSEQPKALHTFHCFCSKRRMENLVEATASFKIVLQGWTGQAYFQIITDQTSALTNAGRCFGIKFQPVLHPHIASHLECARLPRHACNEREYKSVPA